MLISVRGQRLLALEWPNHDSINATRNPQHSLSYSVDTVQSEFRGIIVLANTALLPDEARRVLMSSSTNMFIFGKSFGSGGKQRALLGFIVDGWSWTDDENY